MDRAYGVQDRKCRLTCPRDGTRVLVGVMCPMCKRVVRDHSGLDKRAQFPSEPTPEPEKEEGKEEKGEKGKK